MSESIRQNNLFAAEDWKVIYNAFRNVNLQAYDFNSIYNALIDYLRENNPDEFNDYVQHSEMLAHINMLAYLGQMYAFRIDLNARENFFDTAERRESVIKLAQGLSYKPKRNRAAQGLCKITSISTTEPVPDTQGNSLAGREIVWDQVNDPNWFENFIRVMNRSFLSVNRFGEPVKTQPVDGIRTEIYGINSYNNAPIVYEFNANINGTSKRFEVVSADIDNDQILEFEPIPNSPFRIVYRNDERGNSSPNTGFFFNMKQGQLQSSDFVYSTPVPDREELLEVDNINETDLWLHEIRSNGSLIESWQQVPSLVGQNVIYNDIFLRQRKIYASRTESDNQVLIRFSDGNFGDVPLGNFRAWYRVSENNNYIIRPNDIRSKTVTIPYTGSDNQRYNLTVKFSLQYTIDNAEAEESIEEIKKNAPLSFYTQDRMINGEDYNIYPLTQTNLIRKNKAVNRTHAGHSRYIDITDPTGAHSNVTVVGEDAFMYKENILNSDFEIIETNTNLDSVIRTKLEPLMKDYGFSNFYYHTYRKTVLSDPQDQLGGQGNDFFTYPNERYMWKPLPNNEYGNTGYFYDNVVGDIVAIGENSTDLKTKFLRNNSKVLFINNYGEEKWVTIRDVRQSGLVDTQTATVGNVELSSNVRQDWYVKEVIPGIRTSLNDNERILVRDEMEGNRSFALKYDFIDNNWEIIRQDNVSNDNDSPFDLNIPDAPNDEDKAWLLKAIASNDQGRNRYDFFARGLRYVFGSDKQVRFFFKNTTQVIDYETGQSVRDFVKILKSNTDRGNIKERSTTARAIVGHLYTLNTHDSSTEYDITNIIPYNTNFGNVELYTVNKELISGWTIAFDNDKTILKIDSPLLPENTVTPFKISDEVEIFDFEGQTNTLKRSYDFSLARSFIRNDGVVDYSRILIEPIDGDSDGVPDYPLAFEDIVNLNEYVFFKSYIDFDQVVYDRVDTTVKILNNNTNTIEVGAVYYCEKDVTIIDNENDSVNYVAGKFYKGLADSNGLRLNRGEELVGNVDSQGNEYSVYVGRSFSKDDPFMFKWKHYASDRERIDISISNVIDMYVLTRSYDSSVRSWLKNRESRDSFPRPPTSNEIKSNLRFIERNKSTSDQIIYIPAEYRLLFGRTALPEYQAKFKVIKLPGTNLTDNEIKSRVIEAINTFFDVDNWDFGSGFYYTELSSFIHSRLVGSISSIVIVPEFQSSRFGELFEIRAEPNELFLSTATVDNVEIVKTYTDNNLRKR